MWHGKSLHAGWRLRLTRPTKTENKHGRPPLLGRGRGEEKQAALLRDVALTQPYPTGEGEGLLRDAVVPDHIRVQPLLIPLHVIAHHDLGFALIDKYVRRILLQLLLHLLVKIQTLRRIRLGYRRQRGFVQLRDFPAVQPATVLDLPSFHAKALALECASK